MAKSKSPKSGNEKSQTRATVSGPADPADMVEAFIDALARHRHFERETDPPLV